MAQTINAGIISTIANAISSISKTISNGLSVLSKYGYEFDKGDKTEDGGFILNITTGGGNKFKVKCTPSTEVKDTFDLHFKTEANKELKLEHIKEVNFVKAVQQAADKLFDEDSIDDIQEEDGNSILNSTNPCKKVSVKLNKVTSGTTYDISLCAVTANYSPDEALQAIKDVIDCDDFSDTLAEGDSCYEIACLDDGYDVSEISEVTTPDDMYLELIKWCVIAYYNLKGVHWNVKNTEFLTMHELADDYSQYVLDIIDVLAERRAIELHTVMPNILSILQHVDSAGLISNYVDSADAPSVMSSILSQLISSFELYYANFPHEIQSSIDEWIDYLKLQAEYKLNRM